MLGTVPWLVALRVLLNVSAMNSMCGCFPCCQLRPATAAIISYCAPSTAALSSVILFVMWTVVVWMRE